MLTTRTSVGSNSELRTSTKRIAGLLCVALGSIILVWCGFSLQAHSSKRMLDFRVIYYNLRVLLDHKDPYNALNGEQLAMEDGEKPRVYPVPLPSEITCIYPPSALVVNAPLGFLHRVPAQRLWTALNGGGLIISGFLLWEIAAEAAPLLSGLLIGFLLANSAGLLFQGNVAGIVASLCVIATWCFFRERYVALAIVCMAVSLAIKPHDSGFVWLCLLFIQRYRKPALQVLLVTAMLILISALWVTHVAPGWPGELKANLISVSARGTGNDPGPASGSNTVANADVNLQAIFSVIKDEPAFYNPASYLVCAGLFLLWVIPTLRFRMTPYRFWVALAFLSALTMLPVYHRSHDAKLLMLAVPACALVWSASRRLGIACALVASSGDRHHCGPAARHSHGRGELYFVFQRNDLRQVGHHSPGSPCYLGHFVNGGLLFVAVLARNRC